MLYSRATARLLRRCLELDDQFGWYPPAVFDVDTLSLGPLQDRCRVRPGGGSAAPVSAWAPGNRSRRPACGANVRLQCLPHRLGVLGAQVDLIFRAVEPEAHRVFGLSAVQIVDQQGLYLLRHVYAVPSVI